MANGGWRMADGGWREAPGRWRLPAVVGRRASGFSRRSRATVVRLPIAPSAPRRPLPVPRRPLRIVRCSLSAARVGCQPPAARPSTADFHWLHVLLSRPPLMIPLPSPFSLLSCLACRPPPALYRMSPASCCVSAAEGTPKGFARRVTGDAFRAVDEDRRVTGDW
jgi:hypothetical protein